MWFRAAWLVTAAVVVFGAYTALVDRSRILEANVVSALLERVSDRIDGSYAGLGLLYVNPRHGDAFVARITPTCSVLTAIAVMTWVAVCATRGRTIRRVGGFAGSVAVLIVVDLIRVGGIVMTGSRFGVDSMIIAHDWLGTLFTLASVVLGILILWAVSGGRPRRRGMSIGAT